jgi:hypothetical protein
MKRLLMLVALLSSVAETPRAAAAAELAYSTEPEATFVAPLGAARGTTQVAEVRGHRLAGVYAAWFPCDDIRAVVRGVEEVEEKPTAAQEGGKPRDAKKTKDREYRVRLAVEVAPGAAIGLHNFRLVTPRGASNALALAVVGDRVETEQHATHARAAEAQVLGLPAAVNGDLAHKGELDFYAFDVAAGQELVFEILADFRFKKNDPYRAQAEIMLYERTGSWFDPDRTTPLVLDRPSFSWEPIPRYRWRDFAAEFVLFPRLTHTFSKSGRYFISVGAFLGRGAPGSVYHLRIASGRPGPDTVQIGRMAHPDESDWLERDSATMRQFGSFPRPLRTDRIAQLWARTVAPREGSDGTRGTELLTGSSEGRSTDPAVVGRPPSAVASPVAALSVAQEREPNDSRDAAQTVTSPALIEGTIGTAGDIDVFRLTARAGERLALEIETPVAYPPLFNPWLRVFDSLGRECVANIYKEYGGDGDDVNKTVERKTVFVVETAGDYWIHVRSLAARDGSPEFVYRLLIRPQVPHVGRIELSLGVTYEGSQVTDLTDRMNLPVGETRPLTLLCEKEEGFEGDLAITVDGLPSGVDLLPSSPASWTDVLLRGMQYRPVGVDLISPDHHRPRREVLTLLLSARPDARPTRLPQSVRFTAWPIVQGRRGRPVPAGEIPLIVVERTADSAEK